MQMFGASTAANSQSALTAAIVNEGRFEIDTYRRVAGGGIAFYDGHYYSGQAPGISFISVPLYILSKPIINLLPQRIIDSLFDKLENYGESLPVDFYGNKRIPSNYLPDLSKRQILEYLIISGLILPVFTTSLFSALTVLLLYLLLKRFTKNEKLRIIITILFAFGTIRFSIATGFLQRPLAIFFMLAAFIILFKIRHKDLEPKRSTIFAAGMLAGFSAWFDYFHILAAGLLFLYLLSFYIKTKTIETKGPKKLGILNLNKPKLFLLLSFIIGVSIPIILLSSYHYIILDSPFTTPYAYKLDGAHELSGILNIKLPSAGTLVYMSKFFLFSPIIFLALYGVHKALLKKDAFYHDALAIVIFAIFTLIYASVLTFAYPSEIAPSFKRYMTPILPFIFIFLPYIFTGNRLLKKNKMKITFIFIGIVSIIMNWISAQYAGIGGLRDFGLDDEQIIAVYNFLGNGPSSDFSSALANVLGGNVLLFQLIGLLTLSLIIFLIWGPYLLKHAHSR
ncbi:MAG: hypothetical protein IH934_05515 [Nanoarchaeota archaeon]|nr:hypothetical protein [Nanoarchaeota archaeon]